MEVSTVHSGNSEHPRDSWIDGYNTIAPKIVEGFPSYHSTGGEGARITCAG